MPPADILTLDVMTYIMSIVIYIPLHLYTVRMAHSKGTTACLPCEAFREVENLSHSHLRSDGAVHCGRAKP